MSSDTSTLALADRPRSGLFHSSRLHMMFAASRMVRTMSMGLMARIELAVLSGHKDKAVLDAIRHGRRTRESLLSGNEAFMVFSVARAQAAVAGGMAEVGVFQGCSARLISLASEGRPLHLFDTFAGLPEPEGEEHHRLRRGHYAAALESVQAFLGDRPDIQYHRGLFPETARPCENQRFSFVHLDVDLKSSTRACLEFFYPRMSPGGVILTHDYSYLSGVREAFSDFLRSRPERVIELPTSQAMLVRQAA